MRFASVRRRWLLPCSALALVVGTVVAISPQVASATGSGTNVPITYAATSASLQSLGTTSLASTPAAAVSHAVSGRHRDVESRAASLRPSTRRSSVRAKVVKAATNRAVAGNVPGEVGFNGISAAQQEAANGFDIEPPDPSACVGPGPAGSVEIEIVNSAIAAFSLSGASELSPTPMTALFGQPSSTLLSGPRCLYDASTQRWFFTAYDEGDPSPSTLFVAVSKTSNPLGAYAVFGIDTTDASNTAGGCPCYGGFDQLGADAHGIYVSTNQFSVGAPDYDGVVLYAISKQGIEAAANGANDPAVARYAITSDPFGAPIRVSPATTPQHGTYAPNTEYLVESNTGDLGGDSLLVYELRGTASLASGGTPGLSAQVVPTEAYAQAPTPSQESGPIPFGTSVGAAAPSGVSPDVDAVQQVEFTDHHLYTALGTSVGGGASATAGIAWFSIWAGTNASSQPATQLTHQGYVAGVSGLLYPDLLVNLYGIGYLAFSMAGPSSYPTPAYVKFNATSGAYGSIHEATAGTDPEDGFSCYAPNGPSCSFGEYSGGQLYNGTVYMATEYVGAMPRDTLLNWDTYLWSASTYWAV